jgi:hypothetical protein
MEAQGLRKLKSGVEYDKYFGKALMVNNVIKKDADLDDTMKKIGEMLPKYHNQAYKIAQKLKEESGRDVYNLCKKIWEFIYTHIQYRLDDENTEQLRTPNRIWADRIKGVDCDDYSILISSILICLGVPHKLRLAEYENKGYYQHIYVVVPHAGKEIIMDCVKDRFNQEHAYTHIKDTKIKIDYNMDLYELHGFQGLGSTKKEIRHLVLDKWQAENGDIYEQFSLDGGDTFSYVKVDASGNNIEGNQAETLIESDIIQVDEFTQKSITKDTAKDTPTQKGWVERQMDWVKNNTAVAVIGGIVGLTGLAFVVSFITTPSNAPQPNIKPPQPQVSGISGKRDEKGKKKGKNTPKKHKLI